MPTGMLTQANAWASSLQLKSLFFILIVLISLEQRVNIVPLAMRFKQATFAVSGVKEPLALIDPNEAKSAPTVLSRHSEASNQSATFFSYFYLSILHMVSPTIYCLKDG